MSYGSEGSRGSAESEDYDFIFIFYIWKQFHYNTLDDFCKDRRGASRE